MAKENALFASYRQIWDKERVREREWLTRNHIVGGGQLPSGAARRTGDRGEITARIIC